MDPARAGDLEDLAEQCCDHFHGVGGTFVDLPNERQRNHWRNLAAFLWGLGARPVTAEG